MYGSQTQIVEISDRVHQKMARGKGWPKNDAISQKMRTLEMLVNMPESGYMSDEKQRLLSSQCARVTESRVLVLVLIPRRK